MAERSYTIKKEEKQRFIIEIKLAINKNLYEKDMISEEMYIKAKELILKA
ncbi:MAG: hypothetical protein R3Y27_06770 [Clostridia bacterium]